MIDFSTAATAIKSAGPAWADEQAMRGECPGCFLPPDQRVLSCRGRGGYLRNVNIQSELGVRYARGKSICFRDTAGDCSDDSRACLLEGEVDPDSADVNSLDRISVDDQRVAGHAPCVLEAAMECYLCERIRRASFRLVIISARQMLGGRGALRGVAVVVCIAVYTGSFGMVGGDDGEVHAIVQWGVRGGC